MIHLGGDEVDTTCWTKSPSIMAWLKAKNLTTDGGYGFFVNKTAHLAASQGPCKVQSAKCKVQSANAVHPFFLNLYSLAQIQCRLFFFSFSFPLFRTHTHTLATSLSRCSFRCAILGALCDARSAEMPCIDDGVHAKVGVRCNGTKSGTILARPCQRKQSSMSGTIGVLQRGPQMLAMPSSIRKGGTFS